MAQHPEDRLLVSLSRLSLGTRCALTGERHLELQHGSMPL